MGLLLCESRRVAAGEPFLYSQPARWGVRLSVNGHVAEWLRNGLQNRVHRFNSGRGLHSIKIIKIPPDTQGSGLSFRG